MIEDFIIKDAISIGVPVRFLDFQKIVMLSDEDFSRLYLELMETYKKDGWWSAKDKMPSCTECRRKIGEPKNLRRYCGLSFHPKCFKKYHEREVDKKGNEGEYWKRVANLVI